MWEAQESEDLCNNSGSNSTWIIFCSYSNYYVKKKKMQSLKNNSQEQNYTTKMKNMFGNRKQMKICVDHSQVQVQRFDKYS